MSGIKSWTKRYRSIRKSGRVVNHFYCSKWKMSLAVEIDKDGDYLICESFANPEYYSRMGMGDTIREAMEDFRNDLKKKRRKI